MAKLAEIIRRGTHQSTTKSTERLVYVRDGEAVPRPGWFDRIRTDVWIVDVDPRLGSSDTRSLSVDLGVQSGETIRLELSYSGVRAAPGREPTLVVALGPSADPQQELEARLVAELVQLLSGIDIAGAWIRHKPGIEQTLRQRVAEQLGLIIQVGLQAGGRRGRLHHGPVQWSLQIGRVEEPQTFEVEFDVEDDGQRLPVGPSTDDVALVQGAVAQTCLELSLEDFRRGTNVRTRLAAAGTGALALVARKVLGFKIKLVVPGEDEPNVDVIVDVTHVMQTFQLRLRALRDRIDADDARNFELRNPVGFADVLKSKLQEIAERRFAGQDVHSIFYDNTNLLAGVLAELGDWVRAETGYRFLDQALTVHTAPPQPRQHVRTTIVVSVEPIIGRNVDIEVRATAQLADLRAWLNAGSPDVAGSWEGEVKDHLHTALHTYDDSDALRHRDDVLQRVRGVLEQLGRRAGYSMNDVRLVIRGGVPHDEREIMVHLQQTFEQGATGGASLALGISMSLELIDDWAYVAWRGLRAPGWAEGLLREVVAGELRFRSRDDVRLHREAIESAITSRMTTLAKDRGYRVRGIRIDGLELTPAREHVHRRLDVTTALQRVDDLATWSGTVDIEFCDVTIWVKAGEPSIEAVLDALVQRSFDGACRESLPGAVDTEPEFVVDDLRERLRVELEKIGYRLAGLSGRIVSSNAPEPDDRVDHVDNYKVGQRDVEVKATIVVKLEDASLWRKSPVRSLRSWVQDNAKSVIREVLLKRSYADILSDVVKIHRGGEASVSGLIQAKLAERARAIGYSVAQVLAFPDDEARDMLDGFELGFVETLATKWSQREVRLQVQVNGRFDSFEAPGINGVLSRGDRVDAWLRKEIVKVLAIQLRELTPNDVFFRWEGDRWEGDAKEQATRPRLAAAVADRLRELTMVDPLVQLTSHPPGYIENLRPLRGQGPYGFSINTSTPYGERFYRAMFQVEGLYEDGADNWFSRTEPLTSEKIAEVLSGLLSNVLGRRQLPSFGVADDEPPIEQLEAQVAELAAKRCGVILGLIVRVFNLERVVTATDLDAVWVRLQRQRVIAMEEGNLVKLEQVNRMLGGLALEAGTAGREQAFALVAPPDVLDLEVAPPAGGYKSSDPSCSLPLGLTLHVTPKTTNPIPQSELVESTRHAVSLVLSSVDPVTYWMAFEQPVGDGPSLRRLVEQSIEQALMPRSRELGIKIEIIRPSPTPMVEVRKLCGDVATPEREFFTDVERIPTKFRAKYTILDAAPGRWSRLMQSRRDEASRTRWTLDWLERHLKAMTRSELVQQPGATIVAGFAEQFAEEFGLSAVLRTVLVVLDYRQRDRILAELARLDEEIAVLQTKDDGHAELQLAELRSHRAKLLDELARIERGEAG